MSETTKDLMEQFIRLEALMHRYQLYSHKHQGPFGNPHRGQGRVLAILKMQPEISQKELGYLLDMRNQSLGELLGKLERSGYITRTPSETDRRTTNIKLTPQGAKAAAETDANQDADSLFACLSDEEQANLSDYLERMIVALEQKMTEGEQDFAGGMDGWCGGDFGGHRPPHGRGPGEFDFRRDIRHFGGLHSALHRMGHGPVPGGMPGAEWFNPDGNGPDPNRDGCDEHRRDGHWGDHPKDKGEPDQK